MAILKSKQLSKNLSGSFTITGSLETTENISGSSTSTGSFGTIRVVDPAGVNIDAVGTVSGSSTSTGSFGSVLSMGRVGIGTTNPTYELDVSGDVGVDRNIYHNDDDDTKLEFTSDRVRIDAGNITFLDIRNTSQDFVTIGASSDVDVKLQGGSGYVFVKGSDGFVGVGTETPEVALEVIGSISGSSTSTGSFGRIDTSGDIYSSGRIYESGTSVIDHATAMAIVFGG